VKYLPVLKRVLLRSFPDFKTDAFRTAMDLEKSFGPAYARGSWAGTEGVGCDRRE
jgi:hypothetical protein